MAKLTQMNRLNQILLVVLAIQIALAAVVFWPRTAASEASGPLFADFKASDVVELVVSDGDDNRLVLARKDEAWVLSEGGNYPANGDNVTALLEKIEAVKTNRLVTQTGASHRRLQVAGDDFNRRLDFTLKNGSTHQLFIGSSGGASATHVRADNQPEVYLTGDLNAWEANAQASGWIDTLYFTLPQTATIGLTLENENGKFEFEQEGGIWTMKGLADGEIFDESALTSLVSQVSSIRMTEPTGTEEEADFGLDVPQATVILETADKIYTLRVGAQDPDDNSFVFKASSSPYYVWVAELTGNNLADKTRDDFLQEPATTGG